MTYTKTTLKKLETLFEEIGYVIRYEKGNFQAGYCMVENKKIAVINKFYDTEGRINCLVDILKTLDIVEEDLSHKSRKLYQKVSEDN